MKSHFGSLHGLRLLFVALILPILFTRTAVAPPAHAIVFGTPAEFQQDVLIKGSLIVASGASILSDILHFNEPVVFLDEFTARFAAFFENTMRVLGKAIFVGNIILPKNSAGIATVSAFTTRVTVPFAQSFDTFPIVTLTPRLRNTSRRTILLASTVTPFVTAVSLSEFTITLNRGVPVLLEYNWMAVATGE